MPATAPARAAAARFRPPAGADPLPSVRRGPSRSITGPDEEARGELGGRGDRDDEAGRPEPEAADVVQVDDEERQHDAVPERVDDARRSAAARPAAAGADRGAGALPGPARSHASGAAFGPSRSQAHPTTASASPAAAERAQVELSVPLTLSPASKAVRRPIRDRSYSRPWTATPCSLACAGSRSRRRRGATATPGTRFHVYPWPGAARDVHERIADAALVHRLTGCCPTVALHIPWDRVDDWGALRALRRGARACGSERSTRTSSATTPTGSAACATPTPPCAGGRSTTASSASRSPARSARRRSASGSPTARTTRARTPCAAATRGSTRASRSSTPRCPTGCGCSSSTSSSSRRSSAPTSPTGAPRH